MSAFWEVWCRQEGSNWRLAVECSREDIAFAWQKDLTVRGVECRVLEVMKME